MKALPFLALLFAGCSAYKPMTQAPPPVVVGVYAHPIHLNFPATVLGSQSDSLVVVVTNATAGPVEAEANPSFEGPFTFGSLMSCKSPLNPGQTCNYSVRFAPVHRGAAKGAMRFKVGGVGYIVSLSGTGQ